MQQKLVNLMNEHKIFNFYFAVVNDDGTYGEPIPWNGIKEIHFSEGERPMRFKIKEYNLGVMIVEDTKTGKEFYIYIDEDFVGNCDQDFIELMKRNKVNFYNLSPLLGEEEFIEAFESLNRWYY